MYVKGKMQTRKLLKNLGSGIQVYRPLSELEACELQKTL